MLATLLVVAWGVLAFGSPYPWAYTPLVVCSAVLGIVLLWTEAGPRRRSVGRPVVLAPAMNTLMWQHPLTAQHLGQIAATLGAAEPPPAGMDLDQLVAWMSTACPNFRLVAPQAKQLACGDVGLCAMAELEEILNAVSTLLIPAGCRPAARLGTGSTTASALR